MEKTFIIKKLSIIQGSSVLFNTGYLAIINAMYCTEPYIKCNSYRSVSHGHA